MLTLFEKHCEILCWTANQYSKDTIERLIDIIHSQRPTEQTINILHRIIKLKPTEQEFLNKLKEKFPEERI